MVLNGEEYYKPCMPKEKAEESTPKDEATQKMFLDVPRRLIKASKKAEKVYNLRRRHVEFYPNQAVWKKNYLLSDAAKYLHRPLLHQKTGNSLDVR